jgi:hypothetical protein
MSNSSLMAKKNTPNKTTSEKVATTASKILKNNKFSKKSQSVAGSALAQAKGKKK